MYQDKEPSESASPRTVIIVAGEASGDLHGSRLVRAMKGMDPTLEFVGIGGTRMQSEGVRVLFSSTDMAVVGLTEGFSRLATIVRAARAVKSLLRSGAARLLILIDYPDFNLHVAKHAGRYGVPVFYYISPQVWAWRRNRVKKIARRADRLAVILPFEEEFYRERGVRVDYVGHPLLDGARTTPGKARVAAELGTEGARPVLGLVPGSREEEVSRLLPVMIHVAERLKERFPRLACVLPLAETIRPSLVESLTMNASLRVAIVPGDTTKALSVCDAAMVTSGTATLEAAIMGVPMVVVYRVSAFSHWVGSRLIHVPFISLVNLIAGKEVVRELIQGQAAPDRLHQEVLRILVEKEVREAMLKEFDRVRVLLGRGGASAKAAEIAMELIGRTVPKAAEG
jgi:lipid-A-disaccharide synthase